MNYSLMIFGIIWLHKNNIFKIFLDSIKILYFFIIVVALLSFIYSFFTGSMIGYEGLISKITGISNAYTQININSSGYLEDSIFPRTRLFGIFSNSSAIVIYIISVIYLIEYQKSNRLVSLFFILLSMLAILTTGSRIVAVSFIGWSLFFYIGGYKKLKFIMFIFFLCVIIFYQDIYDFFILINEARGDSSSTRLHLYLVSIKIMLNENMFFGLGLKPRIDLIQDLPIGSHSTIIGYFVKNGIIGGIFFLLSYLYIFSYFVKSIFFRKYKNKHHYQIAMFFLSIVYIFEDLDAFEFVSFLTGILIYLAYIQRESNGKIN
jgi:hypothetical protein